MNLTVRFTEDGHMVSKGERVYEILWQWFNAESQQAYSHITTPEAVPEGFAIYKYRNNCDNACMKLNEDRSRQLDRLVKKWT
jgi:hypothetical protein